MSEKVAIIISPNWRDYAKRYLADCMDSLRRQTFRGQCAIFLIDSESTDESYSYLKSVAPEAEVIRFAENVGYVRGNNGAIRAALERGFDYIVLFNMDVVVDENCIAELVAAAGTAQDIGAVQARVMLWPEQDLVNSMGNVTHFLGFGYCRGYREPVSAFMPLKGSEICYPSGAGALFKAEALREVGLFDEEYWMYNEDQDLGWRIWLSGRRCVLAPDAVVYHKYEFGRTPGKLYWLDRNRILSMLKNYHALSLAAILPALLVMELGILLFAAKGGWLRDKLRMYRYLLSPGTWKYLWRARRQSQSLRRARDREVARLFSGRVWYEEISDYRLRLVNPIFNAYWQIVKRLMFW